MRPMNVLSDDQDSFQESQSRPIYDSFASAARVSKPTANRAHRVDVDRQKHCSFGNLAKYYELSYLAGPIFFDKFLW